MMYEGRWLTNRGKEVVIKDGVIRWGSIKWADGTTTSNFSGSSGGFSVVVSGETYRAQNSCGLLWDDGDVWVRCEQDLVTLSPRENEHETVVLTLTPRGSPQVVETRLNSGRSFRTVEPPEMEQEEPEEPEVEARPNGAACLLEGRWLTNRGKEVVIQGGEIKWGDIKWTDGSKSSKVDVSA